MPGAFASQLGVGEAFSSIESGQNTLRAIAEPLFRQGLAQQARKTLQ
jgi:hypothetical protein